MTMHILSRGLIAALSIAAAGATSSAQEVPCNSLINFRTYGTAGPGELVSFQLELINAQGSILSRSFVSGEWTDWIDVGTSAGFIGDLCGGQVQYMYKWRSNCPGAPEGFSYVTAYAAEWGPWQPQLEMRTVPERPIEGEVFDVVGWIPNLPTNAWWAGMSLMYDFSADGGVTWIDGGPAVGSVWPSREPQLMRSLIAGNEIVRLRLNPCGTTYYSSASLQPVPWIPQLEMRTIPERPAEGEAFQILGRLANLPTYTGGAESYVLYETSYDGGVTWNLAGNGMRTTRDWSVLRTEVQGLPGYLARLRIDWRGTTYYSSASPQPETWIPQLEMRTEPERPVEGEPFQVFGRITNLPTYARGPEWSAVYEVSRDGGMTWSIVANSFLLTRDWRLVTGDAQSLPGFIARLRLAWQTNYNATSAPSQPPVPWVPNVQVWTEPAVPVAGQNLTIFARTTNRPTFGATWLNYLFYASDDRGATWSNLGVGGDAESIFTPPTQFLVSGSSVTPGRQFRVALGSLPGYDTSVVIEVPPLCPADFDGSGFTDSDDFVFFLSQFSLGCDGVGSPDAACTKSADFDRTGFVDSDDFVAYLDAFDAACP